MPNEELEELLENEFGRSRGGLLTTFLIIMFIANPLSAYVYLAFPALTMDAFPKITIGITYLLASLSILNISFAYGIWKWKKWGLIGLYSVAFFTFLLNIYLDIGYASAFIGLIGVILIFAMTRNKFQHFS